MRKSIAEDCTRCRGLQPSIETSGAGSGRDELLLIRGSGEKSVANRTADEQELIPTGRAPDLSLSKVNACSGQASHVSHREALLDLCVFVTLCEPVHELYLLLYIFVGDFIGV